MYETDAKGWLHVPAAWSNDDGDDLDGSAWIAPDHPDRARWDAVAARTSDDETVTKADDADPKEPAGIPAQPEPDDRWPAWTLDAELASIASSRLIRALAGLPTLELAQQFLTWAEGQTSGDASLTTAAIRSWLASQGITVDIAEAISDAYTEAYALGHLSALSALAHGNIRGAAHGTVSVDWQGWKPGDIGAARRVLSADGLDVGLESLLRAHGDTISTIEANRLDEIASVLADGLERGAGPKEIATALRGIKDDRTWALTVAWTETNRAQSAAAIDTYEADGTTGKEWMTAHDQRVCAICLGNETEGPIPIAELFSSGDPYPPGHPRCRCAPVPVRLAVDKSARADLTKVGPKGYVHGWIKVGVPTSMATHDFEREHASADPFGYKGKVVYRGVNSQAGADATRRGELGGGDAGRGVYFGDLGLASSYANASMHSGGGIENGRVLRAVIHPEAVRKKVPAKVERGGHAAIEAWAKENGIDVTEHVGMSVVRNPAVLRFDQHDYTAREAIALEHHYKGYDDEYLTERGYTNELENVRNLLRDPNADKSARAVATGNEGNAERLHRYWTVGPGLAKWRANPHPWTALYHHLRKYLPDNEAKRTTTVWFHEVTGHYPNEGHKA